jgi:uncharacterized protein (DUF2336 family)
LRPLIRHLFASGQLTAGLVLRALLPGNIALFEEALAELSGIPLSRVSALVHDRFGSGLRPLFEKAQLPASMHAAFKEAIKAMRNGLAEDADDACLQRPHGRASPRRLRKRRYRRYRAADHVPDIASRYPGYINARIARR